VLGFFVDATARRFAIAVVLAFLPAAVLGVMFHKVIKSVLFNPLVVSISLVVGGVLILLIERMAARGTIRHVDDIDYATALKIGFCQALAMVPGVSRSGATIMGARLFGVQRAAATEFSFFLAIPTMLGATVYDGYKNFSSIDDTGFAVIAVGFVVAFLAALAVVKVAVAFISRHGFGVFAWYRILLGGTMLFILLR
ncbi:MAG: undecaprenyl-diphosphate phosphatase, partial [Ferrovibrionaceae bacterium]